MSKGKAYGFIDCGASKREFEEELPTLRDCARTPSKLRLSLMEGIQDLRGDANLKQIAREQDRRYVLEATYAGATNRETADELADILNQTYQSPLFQIGDQVRGKIVYEEKGEYVSRE